jgi:hypothetical protein
MMQASEQMRYEMAAKYRDLRKTVIKLSEQQKMATAPERDVDIFGYYREGVRLALQLFTLREGNIVGRREFFWEDLPEDDFDPASFLSEVLGQYYAADYVPKEIDVPVDFDDRVLLEKALSERQGRRVHIINPQRGEKRDMIDLVEKNAKLAFEQRFRVLRPDMQRVLEELQETLELPHFPARIESFDVSPIIASVASCVTSPLNSRPFPVWVRSERIGSYEISDLFNESPPPVFRNSRRSSVKRRRWKSSITLHASAHSPKAHRHEPHHRGAQSLKQSMDGSLGGNKIVSAGVTCPLSQPECYA